MSKDPTLAAAILAGGRARRFGGVDKGALTLDGASILHRILEAVRPIAAHVFVVGRGLQDRAGAGLPVVDDVVPGAGTLCAIYGRTCAVPLRERIERGERQAAVPLEGLRLVEIGPDALAPFDPEGLLFVNVNTPHDHARARRIVEAGRGPA